MHNNNTIQLTYNVAISIYQYVQVHFTKYANSMRFDEFPTTTIMKKYIIQYLAHTHTHIYIYMLHIYYSERLIIHFFFFCLVHFYVCEYIRLLFIPLRCYYYFYYYYSYYCLHLLLCSFVFQVCIKFQKSNGEKKTFKNIIIYQSKCVYFYKNLCYYKRTRMCNNIPWIINNLFKHVIGFDFFFFFFSNYYSKRGLVFIQLIITV
jgi:hypothetical protein